MTRKVVTAIGLGVALAGVGAASAAAAQVSLSTATSRPVTVSAAATQDDIYRALLQGPSVFCRGGRTPLAPGWTGPPTFVSDARLNLNRTNSFFSIGTRGAVQAGSVRGLAICAKGQLRPRVKTSRGSIVSCGRDTAIGIPVTAASPFQVGAGAAMPVGRSRWRSTLADSTTTALCVRRNAFRSVQTVRRSGSFNIGSKSLKVVATCRGARRPIGWGFALPDMRANTWTLTGTTGMRTAPYVSRSAPKGRKGWELTFQTADGLGAASAGRATAYVTCARPA